MKDKLIMRLLVEGEEKQKLEADLDNRNENFHLIINREIVGFPKIEGKHHINPEGIKNVETAYKIFESIRREYQNEEVTIEINYK